MLHRAVAYVARPDIRRDPARLLTRRLWYDLAPRLPGNRFPDRQTIPFDANLRIRVNVLDEVGRAIYKYGVYEHFNVALFRELVTPGAVVLDAGANIGQYALLAAKATGPSGRVLAFEPDPVTAQELRHNVEINGFSHVAVFELALAARAGDVPFYRSPQQYNAGLASLRPPPTHPSLAVRDEAQGQGTTISVSCVRFDDVIREQHLDSLDVMKLDVEGSEHDVLIGAERSISAFRPSVLIEVNDIEETDGGFTARSIDWLRERGYRLFGSRREGRGWHLEEVPRGGDPRPFKEHWQMRPEAESDPSPDISPNLVALHPDSPHWSRLRLP